MMFKDQNVFFITKSDRFFYLYADALINKANIAPECIKVVVFDCVDNGSIDKVPGVDYLNYDENTLSSLDEARTITFMSLNQVNSTMVRNVIDYSAALLKKTYIFLTDDEIDRWHRSIDKHGKIVPSKKLAIAQNDIYVSERIINFIGHEKTFYERITSALQRADIEFVNAGVIFDTLPTSITQSLEKTIVEGNKWITKEKRVLVGTKQKSISFSEIKALLSEFCNQNEAENYKFTIFWHKKNRKQRILLDIFISYLRHIKRQTLDVSYVTAISPVAYTSLIMSCSHLILQRRGGASTARQYIKWGQGTLCTSTGSPNDFGFKEALGLDIISYSSTKELVTSIVENRNNVEENALNMTREEARSIAELQQVYATSI
ncbi:hypothetical protein [Vibrio sp. OPT18]|uniref:hypothetical protein n=1 Tax=Vibrio sp. OPT18 TaxID=2778641 RepID=UPI001881A220|nr:hypothetical protein [Vibrio sp. OPT18]MBE8578960.1 hypothetical protein [Vibrio sp. OPT18]